MRDTMAIMQMAVFNCLNGNLTYDGNPVPVADEKRRIEDPNRLFVLLGEQTEDDTPEPSDAFITDVTIEVIIWDKTDYEISKARINDVSNQIVNLVIPSTYGSNGLTAPAGIQIQNVRRLRSQTYNYSLTDSESIVGRVIVFGAQIVEQNP